MKTRFRQPILSAGVRTTAPVRRLMKVYNSRGILHNSGDDLAGLREQLDAHFTDVQLAVPGCVALFEAGNVSR